MVTVILGNRHRGSKFFGIDYVDGAYICSKQVR